MTRPRSDLAATGAYLHGGTGRAATAECSLLNGCQIHRLPVPGLEADQMHYHYLKLLLSLSGSFNAVLSYSEDKIFGIVPSNKKVCLWSEEGRRKEGTKEWE